MNFYALSLTFIVYICHSSWHTQTEVYAEDIHLSAVFLLAL